MQGEGVAVFTEYSMTGSAGCGLGRRDSLLCAGVESSLLTTAANTLSCRGVHLSAEQQVTLGGPHSVHVLSTAAPTSPAPSTSDARQSGRDGPWRWPAQRAPPRAGGLLLMDRPKGSDSPSKGRAKRSPRLRAGLRQQLVCEVAVKELVVGAPR
jgi:hypothetical protein